MRNFGEDAALSESGRCPGSAAPLERVPQCRSAPCWRCAGRGCAHSPGARSRRTSLSPGDRSTSRPARSASTRGSTAAGSCSAGSPTAGSGTSARRTCPTPPTSTIPFPVLASGGRSLNLRILANLGVTLLGRLEGAVGEHVKLSGSPDDNIGHADQVADRIQARADDYIAAMPSTLLRRRTSRSSTRRRCRVRP